MSSVLTQSYLADSNTLHRSPKSETSTCCHSDEQDNVVSIPPFKIQFAPANSLTPNSCSYLPQCGYPFLYQYQHLQPATDQNAPAHGGQQKINRAYLPKERDGNRKLKNQLCRNFLEYGYCPYNRKCQFAHGSEELRQNNHNMNNKYKTKECRSFFEERYCPFGIRCNFLHRRKQEGLFGDPVPSPIIHKENRRHIYQNYPELQMFSKKESRLFPTTTEKDDDLETADTSF